MHAIIKTTNAYVKMPVHYFVQADKYLCVHVFIVINIISAVDREVVNVLQGLTKGYCLFYFKLTAKQACKTTTSYEPCCL